MRIVLAPDSFKGSLDAPAICRALETGLRRVFPKADIVHKPLADGGEGTLDAVLEALRGSPSAQAQRHTLEVQGAGGEPLSAAWGEMVDADGTRAAILEAAQVVGITDANGMAVPVGERSSIGLGQQLRHVLAAGIRRVYIGLGGSSTNDGGAGLLVGLGARLVNRAQMSLPPTPECLEDAHEMDVSGLPSALYETQLILLSDVNNPLCGPRGATAIFGPQKGVTPDLQARYDHALARFADVLEAALGADGDAKGSVASSTSAATPASFSGNTAPRISSNVVTNTTSGTAENIAAIARAPWRERPGAGAAGGLGYALQCLGAEFRSGAEVVADLVGLDAALDGADWLITGEGRSDAQTLMGKTPHAAARRANARGVPVSLVSGGIDLAALPALGEVFTGGCHALAFGPMALAEAIAQTPALLPARVEQLARLVQSASARRSG